MIFSMKNFGGRNLKYNLYIVRLLSAHKKCRIERKVELQQSLLRILQIIHNNSIYEHPTLETESI